MDPGHPFEPIDDAPTDDAGICDDAPGATVDGEAPEREPQFSLRELFIFEAVVALLLAIPLIRHWLIGAVGILLLLLAVPVFFQCLLFAALKWMGWLPDRPRPERQRAEPSASGDWAAEFHR